MNAPHSNIPRDPFHNGWTHAVAHAGAPAHVATAAAPIATTPLAPVMRTTSKIRWGRIVLSLAGASMIALAAWTTISSRSADTSGTAAARTDASAEIQPLETAGSSATTVAATAAAIEERMAQGKPGAGLPEPTSVPTSVDTSVDTSVPATPPQKIAAPTAAPAVAPMKDMSPSTDAGGGTPPMKEVVAPSDPVVKGGGGVAAPEAAPSEPTTVPAEARNTAPVTGGGGPAAELPYTGAETWIVAILGILVLTIGILVQINAVRIGMTAMLYRRGILLRPVDCARLAGERGLAPVRVWISNALHYLLQEPAGADFVTSR